MKSEFRNLDMLRAIAVMCVFIAHLILFLIRSPSPAFSAPEAWIKGDVVTTNPLYAIGQLGVLLFFVHTSLVLLMSLERTKTRPLFFDFYIRRIFRIYPLSAACILSALLFRIPRVPEWGFQAMGWRDVSSNLLLIQNITHSPDVISPLWTLPWEVQMYAALPFIYLAVRKFTSGVVVLAMWFASAAALPVMPLLEYFPCFMGGVFAFQISKSKTFQLPGPLWPAAIVALMYLHGLMRGTVVNDHRADYVMCLVLGWAIPQFREMGASWLTVGSRTIAKYSYGIYLFHLPVIWFAFVKLHMLPAPLKWATLATLMCAVPWIAYHALEAPMIATGRRLSASRLRGGVSESPA